MAKNLKVARSIKTGIFCLLLSLVVVVATIISPSQHADAAVTTVNTTTGSGTVVSGGNMVANVPSGVQANDLLIVVTGFNGSVPTWTLPGGGGWTQYHQNFANTMSTTLFYKIANGSEPASYTFKPTQTGAIDGGWGMIDLRGADTTTPLLAVSSDYQTIVNTTSFTANTVSWAGATDAVSLIALTYQTGASTITWPSGWNESPDGFAANDGFEALDVGNNLSTQSSVTSLPSKTVTLAPGKIGNANQYAIKVGNSTPAAPTLSLPANSATSVPTLPQFQLRTTDADNDYLRYKIDVCSASDCSSIVRTIDETSSQTGWSGQDQQASTAYTGNSVIASSTMAVHTYQATQLTANTQYWWRAYAIDPGGSNTFSAVSAISTFTTSQVPATPTLITPPGSSLGVASLPLFQLRTTDADNDYLKYFIQIYDATACGGSQVGSNIDQTTSQTNWQGQDQQSATAYSGSSNLSSSSVARYQYAGAALTPGHLYSWRAKVIDPGGSNTFSSLTSCQDFTVGSSEVQIDGGAAIDGGSSID